MDLTSYSEIGVDLLNRTEYPGLLRILTLIVLIELLIEPFQLLKVV